MRKVHVLTAARRHLEAAKTLGENWVQVELPVLERLVELQAGARSWCWPFFHQWQKWETIDERDGAFHANDPISGAPRIIGGRVCYQRRICRRCNQVALRREHAT